MSRTLSTQALVQLDATVRLEVLDRVIHALRDAGADRLTVMSGGSAWTRSSDSADSRRQRAKSQ